MQMCPCTYVNASFTAGLMYISPRLGGIDDPRSQTVIPNSLTLRYSDDVAISKKKKESKKYGTESTAKVAEENRILKEVSNFYQSHFVKEKAKNVKVIAALVQEKEIKDGSDFKVIIMAAGTKHNANSCTLLQQDEEDEKYCWDVCDGHAEAVCLRFAYVYLLHEMCKAQKDQPTSIFDYNATEGGYKLKDIVKFHLFVSHPPCGFMTRASHPLSWKEPFYEKPHILECSSKILISCCLGIQGPLSILLLKPICLSSILILEKENSIEVLDSNTINNYFKTLEHELSYSTSKTLLENQLRLVNDNKELLYFAHGKEFCQSEMMKIVEQIEILIKKCQHVQLITHADLKVEKPHIEFLARTPVEIRKLFKGNELVPDDPRNKAGNNVPCHIVLRAPDKHAAGDDSGDDKMLTGKFQVNKHTTYDLDEIASVSNEVINCSGEIIKYYKQCLLSFKFPEQRTLQLRLQYFNSAIKLLSKALQISDAIKDMRDKMMQHNLQYSVKFNESTLQFVHPESVHESLYFTLPTNVCERFNINNVIKSVATIKHHNEYDDRRKSAKNARDSSKRYLRMWNSLDALNDSVTLADTDCDLARHIKVMMNLACAGANNG